MQITLPDLSDTVLDTMIETYFADEYELGPADARTEDGIFGGFQSEEFLGAIESVGIMLIEHIDLPTVGDYPIGLLIESGAGHSSNGELGVVWVGLTIPGKPGTYLSLTRSEDDISNDNQAEDFAGLRALLGGLVTEVTALVEQWNDLFGTVEDHSDRDALDRIADVLAAPDWDGADFLEAIADIIGGVRPHPGSSQFETRNAYARHFAKVTGRDVIDEDEDEDDYWPHQCPSCEEGHDGSTGNEWCEDHQDEATPEGSSRA